MKKQLLSSVLLGSALCAFAGVAVPYTSDFYPYSSLDPQWTAANNMRGSIGWANDNESSTAQFAVAGATAGAMKAYDSSKAADAWLFSPAVDVKAGTEYTVSIWARTRGSFEKESFKVTMADEATVNAQKAGTVLINQSSYLNTGDFEEFTATFTPDSDGEVIFGVNCYSAADQYTLYLTHFSVTGGGGETPDTPPGPSQEGETLPYALDFFQDDPFASGWTTFAGEGDPSGSVWTYYKYESSWFSQGYAKFEYREGLQEDNWLVSPALAVEKAGAYALDVLVGADGKLDLLLGTDPADLSTFKIIDTITDASFSSEDKDRYVVDINEPGTYYVAFHACADQGSYMGYRVHYAGFKEVVPMPAVVADLTAVPDRTDELMVNLSWTNPALTNSGADLDLIVRTELYRDDELVETFNYPRPGSFTAYADEVSSAGVYTYKVLVYGENGVNTDDAPAQVTTGYVGRPEVSVPFTLYFNPGNADQMALFTIEDANDDGETWVIEENYGSSSFVSKNSDNETPADDYVATPYMHLVPGYYRVDFNMTANSNSYELGYCTNRHAIAETFVKVVGVEDASSDSPASMVVVIEEEGDYCFVLHHYGNFTSSYYNYVKFSGIEVAFQAVLPQVAADLKVSSVDDENLTLILEWTNPALDIVGLPLASLSHADIYRNGELIDTVEGIIPGETSSYVDSTLPSSGDYVYSVEIFNENGKSEADAPETSVFVGQGLDLPYESTDFSDWKTLNLNNDWYAWESDYSGVFGFYQYYDFNGAPDDYALTPYLKLEAGSIYEVEVTTGGGDDYEVDLVTGTSYNVGDLRSVAKVYVSADESVQKFNFAASEAAPSSDAGDASEAIYVPAGKNVFGLYASKLGKIELKSFNIRKTGTVTGVNDVIASGALTYSAGTVFTASPADVYVYSADGRLLLQSNGASEVDLSVLAAGQMVIVRAVYDASVATLKIAL